MPNAHPAWIWRGLAGERFRENRAQLRMDYVRTILPCSRNFGGGRKGRGDLGGVPRAPSSACSTTSETAGLLGIKGSGPEDFRRISVRMGQGRTIASSGRAKAMSCGAPAHVGGHAWRPRRRNAPSYDSWNALWQGALSYTTAHLLLELRAASTRANPCFEWRVRGDAAFCLTVPIRPPTDLCARARATRQAEGLFSRKGTRVSVRKLSFRMRVVLVMTIMRRSR